MRLAWRSISQGSLDCSRFCPGRSLGAAEFNDILQWAVCYPLAILVHPSSQSINCVILVGKYPWVKGVYSEVFRVSFIEPSSETQNLVGPWKRRTSFGAAIYEERQGGHFEMHRKMMY